MRGGVRKGRALPGGERKKIVKRGENRGDSRLFDYQLEEKGKEEKKKGGRKKVTSYPTSPSSLSVKQERGRWDGKERGEKKKKKGK